MFPSLRTSCTRDYGPVCVGKGDTVTEDGEGRGRGVPLNEDRCRRNLPTGVEKGSSTSRDWVSSMFRPFTRHNVTLLSLRPWTWVTLTNPSRYVPGTPRKNEKLGVSPGILPDLLSLTNYFYTLYSLTFSLI